MQVWRQEREDVVVATEQLFWPMRDKSGLDLPRMVTFRWPNRRSMLGGLHSNGAMVLRSKFALRSVVPNECPFNFIEQVRERTFRYPVLLIRSKLANWTLTKVSARPSDDGLTLATSVLLIRAYLQSRSVTRFGALRMWRCARRRSQRTLLPVLIAVLSDSELWELLCYVTAPDIMWSCIDVLKRPVAFHRSFTHLRDLRELGEYIRIETSERFAESRAAVNVEDL
jgi:hypothetical protein